MSEKEKPETLRFRYKTDTWEIEVEGNSAFVLLVYGEIKKKKIFPWTM